LDLESFASTRRTKLADVFTLPASSFDVHIWPELAARPVIMCTAMEN
jgi:hypothetical protein